MDSSHTEISCVIHHLLIRKTVPPAVPSTKIQSYLKSMHAGVHTRTCRERRPGIGWIFKFVKWITRGLGHKCVPKLFLGRTFKKTWPPVRPKSFLIVFFLRSGTRERPHGPRSFSKQSFGFFGHFWRRSVPVIHPPAVHNA